MYVLKKNCSQKGTGFALVMTIFCKKIRTHIINWELSTNLQYGFNFWLSSQGEHTLLWSCVIVEDFELLGCWRPPLPFLKCRSQCKHNYDK